MHFKHDGYGILMGFMKNGFQYHDDEIHRGIIVIMQQYIIEWRGFDPGFFNGQYFTLILVFNIAHEQLFVIRVIKVINVLTQARKYNQIFNWI